MDIICRNKMRKGVDYKGIKWEEIPLKGRIKDWTNFKPYKLLPQFPVKVDGEKYIYWLCKCDCGNLITVRAASLKNQKSCGCAKYKNNKGGFIDETGNKYNKLTVLYKDLSKNKSAVYWVCQCDCGNIISVRGTNLRNHNTQSCGCLAKENVTLANFDDLSGKTFGKLYVESLAYKDQYGGHYNCICECGTRKIIRGTHLRNNITFSCGCMQSKGEYNIANLLMKNDIPFQKEVTYGDLQTDRGGSPRFDFGILDKNNNIIKLIEYQGIQHYQKCDAGYKNFGKYQREVTDKLKLEYCTKNNIPLLIVKYNEYNEDKIMEFIRDEFNGETKKSYICG